MSFFTDFDLTKTFYLNLSNQLDISHPIYGVLFTVSKFHDNYNITLSEYLSNDPSFSLCVINETAVHSNLNNDPLIGNYHLKVYNNLLDVSDIYIYDPSYCTVGYLLDVSFDVIESGEISTQYIIDSINSLCPDLKIIQGINPSPAIHIPLPVPTNLTAALPLTYFSEEQMLEFNRDMNALLKPNFDQSLNHILFDTSNVLVDVSSIPIDISSVVMDVSKGLIPVDISSVVMDVSKGLIPIDISSVVMDVSSVVMDVSGASNL
jgi:hypothetical protein